MGNLKYNLDTTCKHTLIQCQCGAILNLDTIRQQARQEIIKDVNEIKKGLRLPIDNSDGSWSGLSMPKNEAETAIKAFINKQKSNDK